MPSLTHARVHTQTTASHPQVFTASLSSSDLNVFRTALQRLALLDEKLRIFAPEITARDSCAAIVNRLVEAAVARTHTVAEEELLGVLYCIAQRRFAGFQDDILVSVCGSEWAYVCLPCALVAPHTCMPTRALRC